MKVRGSGLKLDKHKFILVFSVCSACSHSLMLKLIIRDSQATFCVHKPCLKYIIAHCELQKEI